MTNWAKERRSEVRAAKQPKNFQRPLWCSWKSAKKCKSTIYHLQSQKLCWRRPQSLELDRRFINLFPTTLCKLASKEGPHSLHKLLSTKLEPASSDGAAQLITAHSHPFWAHHSAWKTGAENCSKPVAASVLSRLKKVECHLQDLLDEETIHPLATRHLICDSIFSPSEVSASEALSQGLGFKSGRPRRSPDGPPASRTTSSPATSPCAWRHVASPELRKNTNQTRLDYLDLIGSLKPIFFSQLDTASTSNNLSHLHFSSHALQPTMETRRFDGEDPICGHRWYELFLP